MSSAAGLTQKSAMMYLQDLEKALPPRKFAEFLGVIEYYKDQRWRFSPDSKTMHATMEAFPSDVSSKASVSRRQRNMDADICFIFPQDDDTGSRGESAEPPLWTTSPPHHWLQHVPPGRVSHTAWEIQRSHESGKKDPRQVREKSAQGSLNICGDTRAIPGWCHSSHRSTQQGKRTVQGTGGSSRGVRQFFANGILFRGDSDSIIVSF